MAERSDVCFVGQNAMGDAALRTLIDEVGPPRHVITRPSLPGWTNPVAVTAAELGLACLEAQPDELSLAGERFVGVLASTDIAVCCGWPAVIAPAAFDAPRRGTVNLHPGSLPEWRGSDPIGWHLAAGWGPITCSAHRMTVEVDAGTVMGTATVTVKPTDTGLTLRHTCGVQLGRLAADTIRGDNSGQLAPPDAGRTLPPRGTRPAFRVESLTVAAARRVIQAFSPYPGAVVKQRGRWFGVAWPVLDEAHAVRLECRDGVLLVQEVDW